MAGMVKGVVQNVGQTMTKTGKAAFNITVDGAKYSAGFDQPKCAAGDMVQFDIEMNGQYKNVAKGTLVNLGPAPPQQTGSVASKSFGGYDSRQDVISRQAATNSALAFLTLAQSMDSLDIKKTAKADEKLAALEALVHKYTAMFYESNTGNEFKDISPATEQVLNETPVAPAQTGW